MSKKRATTVEELDGLHLQMFNASKENFAKSLPLETRSSDVVITPYAKCGTTWLQQMFHQLRTGGDMDFDDISRVVPWIETAPILDIDINLEQRANPRGFKSHLPFDQIPKGAKYINSARHPADAAYSMFKFMEGWFVEPGTVTPDEMATKRFLDEDSYFHHLKSWWEQKDADNVLFLAYEQMVKAPEETIRKVATFTDIELDDQLLTLVLERSSIGYMQTHKDRFDDAMMREMSERDLLPPGSDSAKVRAGRVGDHAEGLSASFLERLDEKWRDTIGKDLGFDTYQSMIDSLD